MWHKALWMRNYKKGGIVLALLFIAMVVLVPAPIMGVRQQIEWMLEWNSTWKSISHQFAYTFFVGIPALLVIVLGAVLIGGERKNQGLDFLMGMTFKRRDIFLSKWWFGFLHIVLFTLVATVILFINYRFTNVRDYTAFMPFAQYLWVLFLVLTSSFTLSLLVGTFTGNTQSQVLLTCVLAVLPIAIYFLIWGSPLVGLMITGPHAREYRLGLFLLDISLVNFFNVRQSFTLAENPVFSTTIIAGELLSGFPSIPFISAIQLIYIGISLPLGISLFNRSANENNGKILLYKKLEPYYLWVAVVLSAMFGGTLAGSVLLGTWSTYFIGFFITGIFVYWILSRILNGRFKNGRDRA
ncbi:MAG: ABC transporter permease [Turicibacter sp.]|nr:ABC transporter permease [Turicibacter sp.]